MAIIFSPNLVLVFSGADMNADNGIIGYHNLVTSLNITASDEDPDFPIINCATPDTYNRWVSDTDDEQTITITTDYTEEVDYVGIARHNWGTGQVQVYIEANILGVWTELNPAFIPADDTPILLRFEPEVITGIRITLTPPASILPSAAVIYVGKLLVLPRRIYVGYTTIIDGVDTQATNGMSESGEFLGRVITGESASTGFSMQNIDALWYRQYMREFIRAGKERPFFFGWRPSSYPREVGYCWLTGNPKPNNQRSNGMMEITLQFGGISL
jgi:hypothetical protein